jgi:osmoprotectant transport system ATP-binding protein
VHDSGSQIRADAGVRVEFRHVSKSFTGPSTRPAGNPAVVDDLSLVIEAGEICVLVGPSGCGKTTTLKMINRLVEPSSGQILMDGQDIMALDVVELRRRIGYVIQQIGLFPHQTIAQNVATVPRLLRWQEQRVTRRVDELLHLVGLDPDRVRDRFPAQLSGGERQRVGVARALAAEPPLLLMDEPFGAVDPVVRERLQDEFLRIQERLGTTVVFVTHDIDEAIKLGTRVAVMQVGGRLAQYSPPWELLARPASDYVAQFVGGDRALKQLALLTLDQLPLAPAVDQVEIPTTLPAATSARQALADLLVSPGGSARVLDDGRELGIVTIAIIGEALRRGPVDLPRGDQSGEPASGNRHDAG